MNDPVCTAERANSNEKECYAAAYQHLSRTLKAWLVGYGIGASTLIASQPTVTDALNEAATARTTVDWFLAGVAIQVIATLIYKASMWYIMWSCDHTDFENTWRYKTSEWFSNQLWLEITLDVASISCFFVATYFVLMAAIK